jgi:arabinoxylan arabinofuranohydrolase
MPHKVVRWPLCDIAQNQEGVLCGTFFTDVPAEISPQQKEKDWIFCEKSQNGNSSAAALHLHFKGAFHMNTKRLTAALTALTCCAGMLGMMPAGTMQTYAAEAVYNHFEESYEGWHGSTMDVQVDAVDGAGFAGTRGMMVTNRAAASEGASSSKGFYLFGGVEYSYGVKVCSEAQETFRLNLLYIDMETGEETTVELDSVDAAAGQWATLSADFTAPENAYEFELTITSDSTNDFAFDEVKVTTEEMQALNKVYAADSDAGLKNVFGKYFRVGNILNGGTIKNSTITASMIKDYSSIECENETKPDATLVQSQCSGTNIGVSLNSAAAIMDFCEKNGIGMRGHAFVWHSQTPSWFFKEGFTNNGAWVSKDTMTARLDSYIKNMFSAIARQYPNLDLYAYDVVNEAVSDDSNRTANFGGARVAGDNNVTGGTSAWVSVYGDNSFVEKAFEIAHKYAPESCKLFYNDYNEYWDHKRDCIYNMCKSLYQKGYLDGIGMQSHINADANGFTGVATYTAAMQKYASIGCEVQVTELDISCENGKFSAQQQADKYKAVFQAAIDINEGAYPGKVTAVCIWGPNDANTWIKTENAPLLYNTNHQPKAAYNTLMSMVPESEWVDDYEGSEIPAPQPNDFGWYFQDGFEGDLSAWKSRGSATLETSGRTSYVGSEAMLVQKRESAWNGAMRSLNPRAFVPGEEFSFSANVTYFDGDATDTFYMKLQYVDAAGETQYSTIAEATGVKGEWVQLHNANYKIPADATDMNIYIETAETTNNFYIDEVIGAVGGTGILGAGQPVAPIKGDVDADGKITAFDIASAKRGLLKGFSSERAEELADIDESGKVEVVDLVQLVEFVMGRRTEFLVTEPPEQPTTESNFNYDAALKFHEAPSDYLNPCAQAGKVVNETYTGIFGTKKLNVYLPYGYDESKKYNIFYLMHGGGENENTIFGTDVELDNMLDHMIMNGDIEPMIVVTPTFNGGGCEADTFYKELRQSVIPFVEGKYSTYAASTSDADLVASRMHRAYGGFSMGALSTWCVGNYALDLVGYLMPLSGDNWKGVETLTNEIDTLGLQKDEYFIMCATGSEDIAYGNMNPQMDAMKNDSHFTYTSDFSKGNFYYMVADGKTHWWGFVRHYVYDCLPYFFHE